MRYIEYAYGGATLMGMIYLITNSKNLDTSTIVFVLIGMTIMSFMYSFRRNQRILMERKLDEYEAEALEQEEEESESTSSQEPLS